MLNDFQQEILKEWLNDLKQEEQYEEYNEFIQNFKENIEFGNYLDLFEEYKHYELFIMGILKKELYFYDLDQLNDSIKSNIFYKDIEIDLDNNLMTTLYLEKYLTNDIKQEIIYDIEEEICFYMYNYQYIERKELYTYFSKYNIYLGI
jgi:hypothetical protein